MNIAVRPKEKLDSAVSVNVSFLLLVPGVKSLYTGEFGSHILQAPKIL